MCVLSGACAMTYLEDAPRGGVLCLLFPFFSAAMYTIYTSFMDPFMDPRILVLVYAGDWVLSKSKQSVSWFKHKSGDRRSNEHKAWHALLRIT